MTAETYLHALADVLAGLDLETLDAMAVACRDAYESGRTIYCVGNGGSAATASHLATDLSKLTIVPGRRRRLRAMALTDSVATLTAAANDIAYAEVFSEQLRTFMDPGDVVIGISTSGSSPNVLRALEYANAHGGVTLGVTGSGGAALRCLARHTLVVGSRSVQQVEDVATVVIHLLCLLTRSKMTFETHQPGAGILAPPASVATSP